MSKRIFCIEDARRLARRRIPNMIFDFIDGAAGSEYAARLNQQSIDHMRLQPRSLVKIGDIDLGTTLLGEDWDSPFGIAPMGMCNLTWPGADKMLAEVARQAKIPLCISTMASTRLETVAELSEGRAWFQLYVSGAPDNATPLIERATNAGYQTLVLTVDVPMVAPRLRELRHGFKAPLRMGPRQLLDFALHPTWSIRTLVEGSPTMANLTDAGDQRGTSRGQLDWDYLKRLRDTWKQRLIIKGVMSPQDAVKMQSFGVEAVYVSNHGGRQLDSAPAAIDALERIRAAVGEDFPLLFDSGIRNGEAIIKALAVGADFVMLGRPFLYGIAADGLGGVNKVVEILNNEMRLALAQIGRTDVRMIDRSVFP